MTHVFLKKMTILAGDNQWVLTLATE